MDSTTFLMSAEQRANSVPVHLRGENGAWEATDLDWSQEPEWWAGGHGLLLDAARLPAFQRMLLGGGALGDVRILEPETVDAAFTNQIGELDFPPAIATADPGSSADFNAGPGYKFGLGLLLNTEDQPGMRAAGSGAWAGIFNTHFWVDRASGVTGAIYAQTLPFVEPAVFQVYVDFERALYASSAGRHGQQPGASRASTRRSRRRPSGQRMISSSAIVATSATAENSITAKAPSRAYIVSSFRRRNREPSSLASAAGPCASAQTTRPAAGKVQLSRAAARSAAARGPARRACRPRA